VKRQKKNWDIKISIQSITVIYTVRTNNHCTTFENSC